MVTPNSRSLRAEEKDGLARVLIKAKRRREGKEKATGGKRKEKVARGDERPDAVIYPRSPFSTTLASSARCALRDEKMENTAVVCRNAL